MNQDAEHAREQLALARARSEQIEQELQALQKTVDPARRIADPKELRLLQERSGWIRKEYEAEHAIAKTN